MGPFYTLQVSVGILHINVVSIRNWEERKKWHKSASWGQTVEGLSDSTWQRFICTSEGQNSQLIFPKKDFSHSIISWSTWHHRWPEQTPPQRTWEILRLMRLVGNTLGCKHPLTTEAAASTRFWTTIIKMNYKFHTAAKLFWLGSSKSAIKAPAWVTFPECISPSDRSISVVNCSWSFMWRCLSVLGASSKLLPAK